MDKDTTLKVVGRFREALIAKGIHPSRVILFGSHATGVSREDSDIDLVLISPDFAGRGLWDRIKWMASAIVAAHTPMDVIPMTPEEWEDDEMIQDIAANGEDV